MNVISATNARSGLFTLIDDLADSHTPTIIRGKRNSAVIMSLEDWSSIEETLYLLSDPKNAAHLFESIRQVEEGEVVLGELKE